MKKVLVLMLILGLTGALQANLLVYEGFDYTPVDDGVLGALAGKNGGIGFGDAWIDNTVGSNPGEAFVYDSAGNIYSGANNPGLPDWDGAVDNLAQTGGYAGLSGFVVGDRQNSTRLLGTDAGTLAGADGVLWASMAVHYVSNFGSPGIGFALTDGGQFVERAKTLSDSSNGIGLGNGTSSLWGNDIDTLFWEAGAEVAGSKTNVSNVDRSQDNVVVIKFEFGATDTVTAWYFSEDQTITEADFIANAAGSTYTIDENTLTTLTIGYGRAENGFDEIRIGDTFADVTPAPVPEPATLALLGLGALVLRRRK